MSDHSLMPFCLDVTQLIAINVLSSLESQGFLPSTKMEHPRSPLKALLPARRAADEESRAQASEPIPDYPERLYSRQHLITRLFSLLLQDSLSLPTSVDFRLSRAPLGHTIPLRRQVEACQNSHTHTRVPTPHQNNNGVSMVDERTKQGAGEGEGVKARSRKLNPLDFDRARHKKRVKALKEDLAPMFPEKGSAVVLLCWGEKFCCSILPVPVSTPEDEVAAWRELNNAWYTHRGYWRKRLPGFGVTRVDIVEITMLGLKDAPSRLGKGEYIGMHTEKNITTERRRLQDTIDSNLPTPDCFYSGDTRTLHCDSDCFCSDCFPGIDVDECPVKIVRAARRDLLHLDTLTLMRHVFSNPVLAASNDFLEKGNLVYSHQNALNQFYYWYGWHCPGLREIRFRGLVINEGWVMDMHQVVLPLVATMFFAVVTAAKFLFDWNTAWNVGSFFVALVTLLWMWATYMAS